MPHPPDPHAMYPERIGNKMTTHDTCVIIEFNELTTFYMHTNYHINLFNCVLFIMNLCGRILFERHASLLDYSIHVAAV